MAKLVVLTEGLTGRSHELSAERTTVGRADDNTFQVPDPSVSSHHCEVLLAGGELRVKDLNSTNGTYINEEQISEAVLKPGQTLRLGRIEIRLEDGAAGAAAQKPVDRTLIMPRGVSLNELEHGTRAGGFGAAGKGFEKKSNQTSRFFLVIAVVVMAVILGALIYILKMAGR
jgi:pSer/pThr/pTyr-binding forkhead associated (FHA) protein